MTVEDTDGFPLPSLRVGALCGEFSQVTLTDHAGQLTLPDHDDECWLIADRPPPARPVFRHIAPSDTAAVWQTDLDSGPILQPAPNLGKNRNFAFQRRGRATLRLHNVRTSSLASNSRSSSTLVLRPAGRGIRARYVNRTGGHHIGGHHELRLFGRRTTVRVLLPSELWGPIYEAVRKDIPPGTWMMASEEAYLHYSSTTTVSLRTPDTVRTSELPTGPLLSRVLLDVIEDVGETQFQSQLYGTATMPTFHREVTTASDRPPAELPKDVKVALLQLIDAE